MAELPRNTKRRFIAGAICPRCREMDSVLMWRVDGVDHRECVSCDFAERSSYQPPAEELATRVHEPGQPQTEADDVQVLRIFDPAENGDEG